MSSSLPSSDPDAVTTLTAMGFPKSKAIVALLRADNDVNRAVELLSTGCKFDVSFGAQTFTTLNLNLLTFCNISAMLHRNSA